mmetsp:Transcript_22839/g.49413  ORF Transcript_22839/g.49413 Transcript_22839/m.49413 type:complete len:464 (-) Transcript_22839:188-1579(-)|eukprot:CAMPEP_0172328256 /NCGR_PEP_ID=MMETSP1058-20130122/60256_1 /TAXON_ID=83371 /ORGANISM="Detonula confervacea, Strain CCMP 353" /LENGTH=463 /DNA_ID=CAMNT_0013045363 /DNA_START=77 /DNA_END=1468 /DNA_ORIENTATION=+
MIKRQRITKLLALAACIVTDKAAAFTSTSTCPRSTITSTAPSSIPLYSSFDRGYDTPINIEETAHRDIQSLEEWAYNYGIQRAEGFQLASFDANGVAGSEVYAMANQDLPAGTPVVYVPEGLILSSDKAMAELRSHDMDHAEKILTSVNADSELRYYYLMVKILVEYEKGTESPWFPWLNSLPRYYTNAASMTPFCCLCLPSLMRKLTVKERGNMARLSVSSIKLIPFLNEDTKYDVDLCNWVYQVVYTRSFETADGDLRIVPMGDMFNHGSDYTEIEPSYDEEGNYCAYTSYDVPAGSPLRISYGDPTNPSFLFARYGFLDDMTPSTFCKIIPAHINKDMEELGYAENKMLFYKTGDVSPEVWDNLLYQHLSSTNIRDRRALMEAHKGEDHEAKQMLHERYYPDTSMALMQHIDGFIEQLDKLSAKTEGRSIEEHPRLPLIWKHNQFVRDTFMTVRSKNFGY